MSWDSQKYTSGSHLPNQYQLSTPPAESTNFCNNYHKENVICLLEIDFELKRIGTCKNIQTL